MTQLEQRAAKRAFWIVNAFSDETAQRRERRADATATRGERVTLESLREPRTHRQRMHANVTKHIDGRGLPDAPRLRRRVLDGEVLGAHELAKQLF
jgi:hypothetical protein